ncbi:hypothetical protein VIN01S_30640 [Vibrio inusitatus NBRC 102082]|uniref:MAPEG family protein n=1 Tax=Vibrio inusitatus NBRC 102082 TaxID=1219070 RepID=A0A4Y3HZW6_9VIBR|nr:MAPEG family protein [Vibrio inusitatus]GEA52260.1 hypothetical protein VIN01S_30640 [Vibrio inusitatus NBRC 102082]
MKLSTKQQGVLKGMVAAMVIAIIVIAGAIYFNPLGNEPSSSLTARVRALGLSLMLPSFCVMIFIGALAKHRFFSPEDIDGSGLTSGTKDAILLQSILQNTLEQCVLAFGIYTAWCLLMPIEWLSASIACSLLFAVGRIAFKFGYAKGAPSRAFGFAVTFYSSVVLYLILFGYLLLS